MRVRDGGPSGETAYPSTGGATWTKDDHARELVDRGRATVKDFFDRAWRRIQDALHAGR